MPMDPASGSVITPVDDPRWPLISELETPLWDGLLPSTTPPGALDLRRGVRLVEAFPDREGVLVSAYEDLTDFLKRIGALEGATASPAITIRTEFRPGLEREEHVLEAEQDVVVLAASDAEGIRRAIHLLQSEALCTGGSGIEFGTRSRRPWVRHRISRCFFSPTNRPPHDRDELADDIDYYHPNYLNRLAHDGVNALWIMARLCDLVPQPWGWEEDPRAAARRLAKLGRVVERCRAFGISIFLLTIEPRAFGPYPGNSPDAALKGHPSLAGHHGSDFTTFCCSSTDGQTYLEQAYGMISEAVPGLGGVIDISLGEFATHCWSVPMLGPNNCPRCATVPPFESWRSMLGAIRRGLDHGNPESCLVSWLYVPQLFDSPSLSQRKFHDLVVQVAKDTPARCTTQINFESSGTTIQDGDPFTIIDYNLSWPGPAALFEDAATAAPRGAVAAKLQVASSHEVATVPFVPVPHTLHHKYRALHRLGVDTVQQCWYFGNFPGLMSSAAGALSMSEPSEDPDEFVADLLRPDWGTEARAVSAVLRHLAAAYGQFPAALGFSYFGPAHDSLVWPLHPDPVDLPLAPTWEDGWPTAGDRIGECFTPLHGWTEILQRTEQLAVRWSRSTEHLERLAEGSAHPCGAAQRTRLLRVAQALRLQFASSHRMVAFYAAREALAAAPVGSRAEIADGMRRNVRDEIDASIALAKLCEDDPSLGYHSESESHRYSAERLRRRARDLEPVLDRLLELGASTTTPLWPGWLEPETVTASALRGDDGPSGTTQPMSASTWTAWNTVDALHVAVEAPPTATQVTLQIEPERLASVIPFSIDTGGWQGAPPTLLPPDAHWQATMHRREDGDGWDAVFSIPWATLRSERAANRRPIRVNVAVAHGEAPTEWWRDPRSLRGRLIHGDTDHGALGWLR